MTPEYDLTTVPFHGTVENSTIKELVRQLHIVGTFSETVEEYAPFEWSTEPYIKEGDKAYTWHHEAFGMDEDRSYLILRCDGPDAKNSSIIRYIAAIKRHDDENPDWDFGDNALVVTLAGAGNRATEPFYAYSKSEAWKSKMTEALLS